MARFRCAWRSGELRNRSCRCMAPRWDLRRKSPQGREACGPAGPAVHESRADHQPCMGSSKSSTYFTAFCPFFLPVSLFDHRAVSSSRPEFIRATSAAGVKAARRAPPEAARSGLDGGEHGAELCEVGRCCRSSFVGAVRIFWRARNDLSGAPMGRRNQSRHNLVFGGSSWIRTMMQSCASAGCSGRRAHSQERH